MLYAQDKQTITVIVRKEGSGGEIQGNKTQDASEGTASSSGGGTTWRTAVFGSESQARIKRVIKTNITHALAVGKQIWGLQVNYQLTGLGYQHGDQAYQEKAQRQVEQIEDVTSVASSVAMGALYGSWGGPIGAVAGALLNGASTAVSISTKYKNRDREFNYKIYKQESGIAYKRARAGINLTTGRLR